MRGRERGGGAGRSPDRESEVTRRGLTGPTEETALFAVCNQHILRLLAGDVRMEPPGQRERGIHRASVEKAQD